MTTKRKLKTLKVSRRINFDKSEPGKTVHCYAILAVTDSIDYHIGDSLDEETCRRLCNQDDWKVSIV